MHRAGMDIHAELHSTIQDSCSAARYLAATKATPTIAETFDAMC